MTSKDIDLIMANHIESTANTISGLVLDDIGEDGHAVANLLWKISVHLRNRNTQTRQGKD